MRNHTKTLSFITGCLIVSPAGYTAESTHKNKTESHPQKRLKTIPAIVEEEAWSANVETNIYDNSTFENITLGYSTSNGWDFSVSLVNAQILGANKQFQGDTFFNIAKTLSFNEDFSCQRRIDRHIAASGFYNRH